MLESQPQKTIFSGMQPTGFPSLGNYVGAIRNWAFLQESYRCLYCIVDMHAITVRQDPAQLRKKTRDLLTLYIAAGLDPVKNIVYIQSHVDAHAQLAWILNCFTYMGELSRMTQFKDKSKSHESNINAGLFTYPTLMAADILLYQTNLVPVGDDQTQHIEICRDIANRFNGLFGETFTIPEPFIPKMGARIMSLQDPTKKMSKSETDNVNNVIYLLDEPNVIMNKCKRAVTDSGSGIYVSKDKPGISNLLSIYCALSGETIEAAQQTFENKGYGDFKLAVGETVVSAFLPIQKKFKELSADKAYIDQVIKNNANRANEMAFSTLSKVKKKVGFIPN